MKICPRCHYYTSERAAFCLFCGLPLSRRARSSARHDTAGRGVRAQRFFMLLSVALPAVSAVFALTSAPDAPLLLAPDRSSETAGATAEKRFDAFNGSYDVILRLSEMTSDDPDMIAAAENIRGEEFDGVLSLLVDDAGVGTLTMQQMFFTQESVSVSPFVDSGGDVSANTLCGFFSRSGMKLSVVCVCEGDSVSGFIWIDSATAHIEFLYSN